MNKRLKKILIYMNKQPDVTVTFIEHLPIIDEFKNPMEFELSLKYLEKTGYLTIIYTSGLIAGATLTYQGIFWKEFFWLRVRLFIKDHVIDFIALIVSIIALILNTSGN